MRTLESKSDRESIAVRVAALTSSDPRLWGKMSAHQMVCHLCDSYKLPLGERSVSMATGFLQRTVIKFLALRAPMKWPHGVQTRPEMEQGVGGTAPAEFERDRGQLLSIIDRFCGSAIDRKIQHPIFGPMTRQEWMRWGYLHADHHLRQFGR
jgi:DinB superfamily